MPLHRRLRLFVAFSSILLGQTQGAFAATIEQQRTWYNQAQQALSKGDVAVYHSLKEQLQAYPLTPYLEYQYQKRQIPRLSSQQAVNVIEQLADTPLANRFKHHYLIDQGKQQQWANFLAVSPSAPNATELQCYFYRALLSQGDNEQAYQGANTLWLTGKSQPSACDPLFSAWQQAGKRTNSLVWQRMLLAFDAHQPKLMAYLATQLTGSYQADAQQLLRYYQTPQALSFTPELATSARGRAMIDRALRRLARTQPENALTQWQQWQPHLPQAVLASTARAILYRSLIDNIWSPELNEMLVQYGSDSLIQQRLRQTIFASDWADTLSWLKRLSPEAQSDSEWQYWFGHVAQQQHGLAQAKEYWTPLAKRRNFYGFLAAQTLQQNYVMNERLPTVSATERSIVQEHSGYQRINELMALNKSHDAMRELRWLMGRLPKAEQMAFIALAAQKNWGFLTVEGTIQTKLWNALSWRFPNTYSSLFNQYAQKTQLDPALLQAVARRESAFYPLARSHADARGLMQLLPATAKATAQKIDVPYGAVSTLYQPAMNIELGAAYFAEMYNDYGQNRLLASAAYNAGPHRVTRWLARPSNGLTAAQFVATIPFRETRDYVQAILSYQMIYAHLAGREIPLLTETELQRQY
ncbi:MAG: transglycosylase SLT domain-containing protein [Ferrimonas sp.]